MKEFLKKINDLIALEDWEACTNLGTDSITYIQNFEKKYTCLMNNEINYCHEIIKNLKTRTNTLNTVRICPLTQSFLLSNLMRNITIHSPTNSSAFIFYNEYIATFHMIIRTFLYLFEHLDKNGKIM